MTDLKVGIDEHNAKRKTQVVSRSLDKIRQSAGRTEKAAKQTDRSFKNLRQTSFSLKGPLAALSAGLLARQFATLSDAATNVANRLRLVTDSALR